MRGCETGKAALDEYLASTLQAYNNRFQLARNRTVSGFTHADEATWQGEYDFVQLADPQIGMFKYDADWAEELTMLRLAIQHINRMRPRFLLISGDLTNAWPKEETRQIVAAQVSGFKEVLRELDPSIPLVLQPGNHDVGQNPTRDDVRRYVTIWGDDYFKFWCGGVLYISINSQYYHIACNNDEAHAMRVEQEAWLEEELSAAAGSGAVHVVLLSHVTPFMGDEDEEHGHFNWEPVGRKWMIALAEKARVKLWLCGHYHGNCTVSSRSGIEVVTTSSCGGVINWSRSPPEMATSPKFNFRECVADPPVICDAFHSGMRFVRVSRARIQHEWVELANVPETLNDVFPNKTLPRRRSLRPALEQIMDLPTAASPWVNSSTGASRSMDDLPTPAMVSRFNSAPIPRKSAPPDPSSPRRRSARLVAADEQLVSIDTQLSQDSPT